MQEAKILQRRHYATALQAQATDACRGKIFSHSHLSDWIDRWRKGLKSKLWILDPGDPTQLLDEMFESMCAILVKAIREAISNSDGEISPTDVVDFMVACAKEDATKFMFLMEFYF